MKECIRCKEFINDDAHKCPNCQSFQGKRRFLEFSSLMLSLIVALISVSTTGIIVFKYVFSKASNINLIIAGINNNQLQILATNIGEKTGVIKKLTLNQPAKSGASASLNACEFIDFKIPGLIIIDPGKVVEIKATITRKVPYFISSNRKNNLPQSPIFDKRGKMKPFSNRQERAAKSQSNKHFIDRFLDKIESFNKDCWVDASIIDYNGDEKRKSFYFTCIPHDSLEEWNELFKLKINLEGD